MTALVSEAVSRVTEPQRFSNDVETAGRVSFGLRRSIASEVVSDELYDDLEAVLGEDARRLSSGERAAIADRLRQITPALEDVVKRLVQPYPEEQMRHVISLSLEQPGPEDVRGHCVRFASSVLTSLDLMGALAS